MSDGNGSPVTRGTPGMTRGGVANISRSPGGKVLDPKTAAELQRKQLEAKRKLGELQKQKITLGKFSEFAADNNSRMLQFSVRIESMFLTLSHMFPDFEKMFKDSEGRILRWRQLVHMIENSGMSLKEFRDTMVEWNSVKENPTINATCFRQEFIEKTFNVQNPDATLSVEEKMELMHNLGFLEDYIKSRVGIQVASEPPEAEEMAKEAQDDPSEESPEPLVS